MRVERARVMGFCPGVRRAVRLAEESAAAGESVFVLGKLVHNDRVVARLVNLGVRELDEAGIAALPPGAVVVIRSHGAAPAVFQALRAVGARVVDATCPKVAANQRAAAAAGGRAIVIAGDRGHGETTALAAHAPGSVIVSSAEEAASVRVDDPAALVAQTTFSAAEYGAVREVLTRRFPALADLGGICDATASRQEALRELCARVDAVVVVGGVDSANTRRLAELAVALGKPAWRVGTAADLPPDIAAYDVVGLTAGASTPGEAIDEVERALFAMAAP